QLCLSKGPVRLPARTPSGLRHTSYTPPDNVCSLNRLIDAASNAALAMLREMGWRVCENMCQVCILRLGFIRNSTQASFPESWIDYQ
ncbi:hypothetical protein GBAR_LOCUS31584, partial [Geodia barretti]